MERKWRGEKKPCVNRVAVGPEGEASRLEMGGERRRGSICMERR